MKIYGIRNCDTMKQAFAFLEAKRMAYEFHDYKKDGVPTGSSRNRRSAWAAKSSRTRADPPGARSRTRRRRGLDQARAVALLENNTSAIKRPVLEAGSRLLVGFDPAEYARL